MKIKAIKINNFVGVDELIYNPGNINIFEGPKGSGKSSVLEAIETAVANKKRRTEVVKHGKEEATLFLEMDNGLEISRKVRTEKADYLKLKQEGKGIKSTETELRKFLSGDIFRPLDFINMGSKKQTEIILSMIKMDYPEEEIRGWFAKDVLSGVNTSKHLLQILKDIEAKNYKEREEVNRSKKTLESQVKGIEQGLPANYDGEVWRGKELQTYYNKVSEAQQVNNWINNCKNIADNIQIQIDSTSLELEGRISKTKLKYKEEESDIDDIIVLTKSKIMKAKNIINNITTEEDNKIMGIEKELLEEIAKLKEKYKEEKEKAVKVIRGKAVEQEEVIQILNQKITKKETEINGLEEKQKLEIFGLEKESVQKVETIKAKAGKAQEYLKEHEMTDIDPLQEEAKNVEEMREHLREWDRMLEIRDGRLAEKKAYSDELTNVIDVARNKPSELLKQHELPIDGISVDENSLIRINGTLLDGLSDGEKLEAAFKIALQRIGELRIMCLDGFEKLNETEQRKIIKLCEDEDIQAFITITKDTVSNGIEIKEEL